jgi:hypothetical protein
VTADRGRWGDARDAMPGALTCTAHGGEDSARGEVYGYEVFLSYRRWPLHLRWLDRYFVPLFEGYLGQYVVDKCTDRHPDRMLFRDVEDVKFGMRIPARVEHGIRHARCLVALLSPEYFRSQWCVVEWDSFKTRGQNEGRELVVPAIVHDGETVRTAISDTMSVNFHDDFTDGESFKRSRKYMPFEKKVRSLAERVAEIVKNAPEWKAEFPVRDPPDTPVYPQPKTPLMRLG